MAAIINQVDNSDTDKEIFSKIEEQKKKTTNLENCPRIAGIEPLYNPLAPSSGSFDIICGKVSVDAWTCV